MWSKFIVSAISLGTVYLYGCIGEIITEKAGHLNLGIPGIMCMGTLGGCWGASIYMAGVGTGDVSYILLLITVLFFAILFGALGGLIYAFLTVSLRCNQNVTGLALTTFGAGVAHFMMMNVVDRTYLPRAGRVLSEILPFAEATGDVGKIFFGYDVFVYLAIAIAIVVTVIFKKTRVGLNLRSIGENPAAADAVGINVTKYKYLAILSGSAIAGLGGTCYLLCFIKGSWENSATISGMGWISIALVIFALWKPLIAIIGSFLFGALTILPFGYVSVSFDVMKLMQIVPYAVTILVLIITSVFNSKENKGPAAIGLAYFREDR